jgi:hypothetical protein
MLSPRGKTSWTSTLHIQDGAPKVRSRQRQNYAWYLRYGSCACCGGSSVIGAEPFQGLRVATSPCISDEPLKLLTSGFDPPIWAPFHVYSAP